MEEFDQLLQDVKLDKRNIADQQPFQKTSTKEHELFRKMETTGKVK